MTVDLAWQSHRTCSPFSDLKLPKSIFHILILLCKIGNDNQSLVVIAWAKPQCL